MISRILFFLFFLIFFCISAQKTDSLDFWTANGDVESMYRSLLKKKSKAELSDKEFSHLIYAAQMTLNYKNAVAFATEWHERSSRKGDSVNIIKAMNYQAKLYNQSGLFKKSAEVADYLVKYFRRTGNPQKMLQNQLVLGYSLTELKDLKAAKSVYDDIDRSGLNQ